MAEVYIPEHLAAALKVASSTLCRSQQQQEIFQQASALTLKMIVEMGVEQTILPVVRTELNGLRTATAEAQKANRDLQSIAFSPGQLDERAKSIVALTGCLLKSFNDGLPGGNASRDSRGESVQATIARSVSYIVWAYATGSSSLPAGEEVSNG